MIHRTVPRLGLAFAAVTAVLFSVAVPAANASVPDLAPSQRTVTVPLGDPVLYLNSNSYPSVQVSQNPTTVVVELGPAAAELTVGPVQWEVGDTARGETTLVGTSITVPLPANVFSGKDENPSLQITVFPKRDPLERISFLTDGLGLSLFLEQDPNAASTVNVDMSASTYLSYFYGFGLPGGSVLQVKKGDSIAFVAPTAGFWRVGPDGAGKRGKLQAYWGYKPACGRSVEVRGCGGGVDLNPIPVKVSADGRVATVTFPRGLTLAPKYVPREIVSLSWYEPSTNGIIDSTYVNVVHKVHVS